MDNISIQPHEWWSFPMLIGALKEDVAVSLAPETCAAISRSSDWVEQLSTRPDLLYGVNTGFGALANVRVRPGEEAELQRRHILSHACGVGNASPNRVVRAMLLIKLLTFRRGDTGVSLAVAQRIVDMLNNGVYPLVPERGTVGASGDLAPLAHMSLPIIGLGEAIVRGRRCRPHELEAILGPPLDELGPKDGLALTNGTQYLSAVAIVELERLHRCIEIADLAAAMSLQAFSCANLFFHKRYHQDAGNDWRRVVAARMAQYTEGGSHASSSLAAPSKQDPYSFRCIPQVHGAVREYVDFATRSIINEVNTTSDNPLFFPAEDLALMGGNLHGESVAIAADVLGIAAAELASISERRTYQLLSGNRGLPSFLTEDPGVNSGFMVAQYTAAALVSEAKTLAHPGSVDSIPTCQLQEDHVSMGGTSVLKLRQIVDNLENVLAIEFMVACQAADLAPGLRLSPICRDLLRKYRTAIPKLLDDRVLATDIEATVAFLRREPGRGTTFVRGTLGSSETR